MKKILFSLFVLSFILVGAKTFAQGEYVDLISSIGGGSVEVGSKMEIRWDTNVVGAAADIYVSDGTHKGEVVRANQKSIVYTLGSNLVPGSNYKVYISLADDLSSITDSSGYFTIRAKTEAPSITVTFPNGGEIFIQGQNNKISWTGGNEKVQIGLYRETYGLPTYLGWIVLDGLPNSKVYWDGETLKDVNGNEMENYYFAPGKYKIMATTKSEVGNYCMTENAGCVFDFSDNFFTITEDDKVCKQISEPAPTFCPNGKVKAVVDSNHCVTSYKCVEDKTDTDKGCLPGYKYSPTTGLACSGATTSNCLKGYKFDPMTGFACSSVSGDEDDDEEDDNKVCTEPGSNCGVRNHGISRTLKHGLRGDDVKILQALLNLIQDGIFGPETKQRLVEWQAENGLTPDGIFGTQSRHKAGFED